MLSYVEGNIYFLIGIKPKGIPMLKRSQNETITNSEIVFSYVSDLHDFLVTPTMGLERCEWLSLKKLIESCAELIDEQAV